MSKVFQYPSNPIPWNASPRDLTAEVADVPFLGIYTKETTQRYIPGTRNIAWDGRVFKYCLSGGVCEPMLGAKYYKHEAVGYTTVSTTNVAGDTTIGITAATHDAFAEDELAGGFLNIFGTTYYEQFRGIIGNDASGSSAVINNVHLDGPLVLATTGASTGVEVYRNPYNNIIGGYTARGVMPFSYAGVPVRYISAASYYFWLQSWGPCQVTPQNTGFQAAENHRGFYFRHDGTAQAVGALGELDCDQYAGYVIPEGYSAGPLVFLMCST